MPRSVAKSEFLPAAAASKRDARAATSTTDLPRGQDDVEVGAEHTASRRNEEAALTVWEEERNAFYRDDLHASEEEIAVIDAFMEDSGVRITQIVKKVEDGQLTDAEFQMQLAQTLKLLDDQVFVTLGQKRYGRVVAFRARFNTAVKERFDTELKFTGF